MHNAKFSVIKWWVIAWSFITLGFKYSFMLNFVWLYNSLQPKEYINNNEIPLKVDENSHSEDMDFVINTAAEQVVFTEVLLKSFSFLEYNIDLILGKL